MMRVGSDLRSKALLALEEVCAECRYCTPPRTHAVRFALAYLYAQSSSSPQPFVEFWRQLANQNELHRWTYANRALAAIYADIGAPISNREEISWEMWRRAQARHTEAR